MLIPPAVWCPYQASIYIYLCGIINMMVNLLLSKTCLQLDRHLQYGHQVFHISLWH